MSSERSRTAMYVALYRALETAERAREPLFQDALATRCYRTPRLTTRVGAAHRRPRARGVDGERRRNRL